VFFCVLYVCVYVCVCVCVLVRVLVGAIACVLELCEKRPSVCVYVLLFGLECAGGCHVAVCCCSVQQCVAVCGTRCVSVRIRVYMCWCVLLSAWVGSGCSVLMQCAAECCSALYEVCVCMCVCVCVNVCCAVCGWVPVAVC